MSILDRIISKLRDVLGAVREEVHETIGEIHEHFEKRRAASLAEKLDELARDKPYKNWRLSIIDLAYLVGEDGSPAGRAALWADLGMPGEYKRTAAQNTALHARFLECLPKWGIPWPEDDAA